MIKALFVGRHDWANLCGRIARGMNLAAGERVARVWTLEGHPFGYPEDLIGGDAAAEAGAVQFDWLITSGDGDYHTLNRMLKGAGLADRTVRLATTHAGSAYRQNASYYNAADRHLGAAARFIGADSMMLAGDDPTVHPHWSTCEPVVPAMLPDLPGTRVRIAHSPSSRSTKGTAEILGALERIVRDFDVDLDLIEGVPFTQAIERRARAEIVIDQLNANVGGFGCTAVEAMAAGAAVIADMRNVPWSESFWTAHGAARPPVLDAKNGDALDSVLRELLRDREALDRARRASLAWVREYATPEAVGKRWIKTLEAA